MVQTSEDRRGTPREIDSSEIYELSTHKLFKHRQKIERRKNKNELGDRRLSLRLHTNGEPQLDRREANRSEVEEQLSEFNKPL